jgi:phage shock protein A
MNDLFKKLSTLARASLPDVSPSLPRRDRPPDLDRQVKELRQRINAALDHEDQLQATVRTLRDEIERLDAQADVAIQNGQDAAARHILEQMKRTEQRLAMAEADLQAHQREAHELIRRVNELDATISENRYEQQHQPPQEPDMESAADASGISRVSEMLREAQDRARERIAAMGELLGTREAGEREERDTPPQEASAQPPPEAQDRLRESRPTDKDKDDLSSRVQRLSKPPENKQS